MARAPDDARIDRRLRAAGFRSDDQGVSEIVGSLFLIGITVVLVSGLAILVLNVKPPNDTLHADLTMLVTRGPDGVWGTGDELLRVEHNGGEVIPHEGLTVRVDIDGAKQTFADSGLTGPAFSDGEFTIGEVWSVNLTVTTSNSVSVDIVLDTNRSSILVTSTLVRAAGSCEPDLVPPFVLTWDQSPADVEAATSGPVTITVAVADDCSGVDTAIDPHLEFRLNDGSNPAWTDLGAMTPAGSKTWSLDIPDQSWLTQISKALQYRITGMTDESNNVGNSAHQSDVIQFGGTNTFVSGHTDNQGTTGAFSNAQSDADGGAVATLTETLGVPPTDYYATTATGGGSGGLPTNVAGAPDDTYFVLISTGDQATATPIDTLGASGSITKVEMYFEGHYEKTRNDDVIDLNVDAGSGFITVLDNHIPTFGTAGNDVQTTVDITGLRGSWTFTDVQALKLQAIYQKVGSQDAMDVHVDALWVRVTLAGSTELDVEFTFPSLPIAPTHVVELEYSTGAETFHVEVWDGSTWNRRGAPLDEAGSTIWVYVLTPVEAIANGGSPLLRIVDDDSASPRGTMEMDYLKVVSG